MRLVPPALLLPLALALAACATTADPAIDIPPDAVENTRTEANGDVITEYRVAGQLRMVRVQPSRGPAYYLYERNGQLLSTKAGDNPPQTYFKLFSW
ncbi:MAG: DUF2782 domain-containing protein [Luteimonas sp.]|nr:DUF2782 domain-containing protein [Luteimonas sp.]